MNFENYTMFCNSTGNQTINIIPAIQFNIKKVIILSTEKTQKDGSTKRLIEVMQDKNILSEEVAITKEEEKDIKKLTDKLLKESEKFDKVVWNVSGGQKLSTIAFNNAFLNRAEKTENEDYILYVEGSPPEIWFYGKDYKIDHTRSCANLGLVDILKLYGSEIENKNNELTKLYPEIDKDALEKLEKARLAYEYYIENDDFKEAFFRCMEPDEAYSKTGNELKELIKDILNDVKPKLNEINLKMTGYEELEKKIKNIFSAIDKEKNCKNILKLIKPLKIIRKPDDIYKDYWDQIKNKTVELVFEKLTHTKHELVKKNMNSFELKQLISQIESIGGKINNIGDILYKEDISQFALIPKIGLFFEWMVAASIIDIVDKNVKMKESITDIFMNVKTKKYANPDAKVDSELDIVVATKFGTLIVIEIKSYELSGETAKSKDNVAYKKSGPYGKPIIIGPLTKSMVQEKDGEKIYPGFIDRKIKEQENNAKQNDIAYVYLDKIEDMLKKQLFIEEQNDN